MTPQYANIGPHKLYLYASEPHQRPHIAVRGAERATVDLVTGDVLAGRLSPKAHRDIRAWLEEHREEAIAAFHAVREHRPWSGPDEEKETL